MTSKRATPAVPLVDLSAQTRGIRKEADAALRRVVDSGQYVLGPEVEAFEREFARFCEAADAVGCASGTSALVLALRALEIGAGDEVVTSPFTFTATAEAVAQVGATPVFADVDPATGNLDPAGVERVLTRRTRALLPVHLYGRPAEMDPLLLLAREEGLRVVEDACQAHGARYRGRRAGSMGDLAAFSFYPSKNLGAWGDGGMVTTRHPELADRVRRLANHGASRADRYRFETVGDNSRLDALQAAVLRVKLRRLDRWNEARRRVARAYDEVLGSRAIGPAGRGSDLEPVYHLYVVRSRRRDLLRRELGERGIQTAVHYPQALHEAPAYRGAKVPRGGLPHAEALAREVLSLPMYPELPLKTARRIAAWVADREGGA